MTRQRSISSSRSAAWWRRWTGEGLPYPFPAAMNDCYAALAWTHQQAGDARHRSRTRRHWRRQLGGGSAAGLALMARDRGEYPICFQSLNYPMLDDRNVTPSSHAIVHPRVWNRDTNARAWKAYVGDAAGGDGVSPYAAPSRATDLAGLPPPSSGLAIWTCSWTRTSTTGSDCCKRTYRRSCTFMPAASTVSTDWPRAPTWRSGTTATAMTPCVEPWRTDVAGSGGLLQLTLQIGAGAEPLKAPTGQRPHDAARAVGPGPTSRITVAGPSHNCEGPAPRYERSARSAPVAPGNSAWRRQPFSCFRNAPRPWSTLISPGSNWKSPFCSL